MRKLGRLPGSWAWFLLAGATLLGPYRLRAQAADVSTDEPVDNAVVKRYHAVLPSTKELAAIPGFAAEPTTIDAAFQRLVKGYRVELYPRALRGSRGTFLAKAGNSLDRALLLYTLVSSNPGNGVQSATIAYARLSPEEAARVYDSCDHGLTARLAEQRAAFRVLDDRAAAAGVQDASLRKMQQIRAGILSRLDQFLQQDLAMVAPHLADSAAKAAANLAEQRRQAHLDAQDHYWLQVRVRGKADPLDLDTTYPGLSPGRRVKAPAKTYVLNPLPDELLLPITVTVVANWQQGPQHSNQTVLRLETDAASVTAYPVFLIHPAKGDPFQGGIAGPMRATAGAITGAAGALGGLFGPPKSAAPAVRYAGTTHKPVLYIGPQQFEGAYLERPAPAGAPDPELVAETLSFEIETPVRSKITRSLFDRAGAAQRNRPGKWQLKPMELGTDQAPLALQPIRSLLIATGDLDDDAPLESATGIREPFLKDLFALHCQFEIFRRFVPAISRNGELAGYTNAPQVSMVTMAPLVGRLPGGGDPYVATSLGFDILRNAQTSLSSGDLAARGALDYLLEQIFLEHMFYEDPARAPALFTAHNTLAQSDGAGGKLLWVAASSGLPPALEPDIRAHLATRLATSYVLLPADPAASAARHRLAWLLVDRQTYHIRDQTEANFGSDAFVEYEENVAGTVERAETICQFQSCLNLATKASKFLVVLWGSRVQAIVDLAETYGSAKQCLSVVLKVTAKKEWRNDPDFKKKQQAMDRAVDKGLVTPSKKDYETQRSQEPAGAAAGANKDRDHNVELACGGKNTADNVNPLNSSINRSIGATLGKACGALCEGSRIKGIVWEFVFLLPNDTLELADAGPLPAATEIPDRSSAASCR